MKLGPEDIRLFRLRRSCAKDTDLVYWRQQRCIRRPSIRPEEDFQSVDIGHAQAGGHPWRCRSNYPRLLLLFLLLVSWTAPPAWDLKWALWLVSPIRRCDVVCFIIYALIARYVNKVLNNKMQQIGTNFGHADRMLRFSILKSAPKIRMHLIGRRLTTGWTFSGSCWRYTTSDRASSVSSASTSLAPASIFRFIKEAVRAHWVDWTVTRPPETHATPPFWWTGRSLASADLFSTSAAVAILGLN